jgi:hypothetical protein
MLTQGPRRRPVPDSYLPCVRFGARRGPTSFGSGGKARRVTSYSAGISNTTEDGSSAFTFRKVLIVVRPGASVRE